MAKYQDGPVSPHFFPVALHGSARLEDLSGAGVTDPGLLKTAPQAMRGECTAWGIPFVVDQVVAIMEGGPAQQVDTAPLQARWLVFLHTANLQKLEPGPNGFIAPTTGEGRLNEHAADYIICYEDGSEARAQIRRRHQIGSYTHRWGENCFQAVVHHKPRPVRPPHEQANRYWGFSQTRVSDEDYYEWTNWLWAWENPHPEKTVTGLRFEPLCGTVVISGVAAGSVDEQPLRWRPRLKALLTLPEGLGFQPDLDDNGLLAQIQLDLGTVISALPRPLYPEAGWSESYNNQLPSLSKREILIEYTANPAAHFHLWDGVTLPAAQVEAQEVALLQPVAPARQRVRIRAVERVTGKPVAVKLHLHGTAGEYLPPVDRHRIPNPQWFEDYSVDFTHLATHHTSYIYGETTVDLPLGKVYLEVSKGFEIRPVRKVIEVNGETDEVVVELERVLPWRERGWVSADTHVHFLSPVSAMLEGAGEGVNVVNLLASQWGELMTNAGDFDGRTTWGAPETGGGPEGNGEYVVRVGTENRQHILGHISLLGYNGPVIAPMTTGGPDESALGDPIEILLTEWARQCRKQGGLVVLPHFPNPRAEHAASIVCGDIDALEMTSWEDLYDGINPYSLSDWYRYLNCGYLVPAVGGTDKMTAITAVGTVRTYARLPVWKPFTFAAWMEAVRRRETFVTYGPLLEFHVDGRPMGSRIGMSAQGGTVDVTWSTASATVPMSRVELVVNGEIRESAPVEAWEGSGSWRVRVDRSAWLALLVRGHYPDKPEIIAAHSTPVMVDVDGSEMLAAADAVTILEQIEGALAYLDTVGTRADDRAYKRMRLTLEAAHRTLHNRMHQSGQYHEHGPGEQHEG